LEKGARPQIPLVCACHPYYLFSRFLIGRRPVRWYNIPPPPQKRKGDGEASVADATADGPVEMDSRPINFDTFVPTHDPSLAAPSVPHPLPIPGLEFNSVKGSGLPGPKATRDEAFMRALGAMFWTGYWSAVYYVRSHRSTDFVCFFVLIVIFDTFRGKAGITQLQHKILERTMLFHTMKNIWVMATMLTATATMIMRISFQRNAEAAIGYTRVCSSVRSCLKIVRSSV
jgi:hypothetical protein